VGGGGPGVMTPFGEANFIEPSLHGKSVGSVTTVIANKMKSCVSHVQGLHADAGPRDFRVAVTNLIMNNPGCSERDNDLHGGWEHGGVASSAKHYVRFDEVGCRRASTVCAGHRNADKIVKPPRFNFPDEKDMIRWDRFITGVFDNPFFQVSKFENGRLMPLCRWSFASMLMHLGSWVDLYTQNHIVVQAIIREARKENISLQTLYDSGDEIRKDYVSRNSLCVLTDDVPVAQILEICSSISTEMSGFRELMVQANQTIKGQEKQLKDNKVSQLGIQAQLKDMSDSLINTQNTLQNLINTQMTTKRKGSDDINHLSASKKRSKPEEKDNETETHSSVSNSVSEVTSEYHPLLRPFERPTTLFGPHQHSTLVSSSSACQPTSSSSSSHIPPNPVNAISVLSSINVGEKFQMSKCDDN